MKTIILAGGFGTRLSEYTDILPKPMVPIGGKPILWHIMQRYSSYGHKDFFIALGYKAEVIKEYFLHYRSLNSDFTDVSDMRWNIEISCLNELRKFQSLLKAVIGGDNISSSVIGQTEGI